ncbi:C40 family peptidase [Dokdonella soli]|uniref:NlpC/P60 domain-containing protein n=1 Tax=Dokdonella soli TaxID=529810 RepID=A0ABN1J027_9GAMM
MDASSAIASTAMPASGAFLPSEESAQPAQAATASTEPAPAGTRLRKLLTDFAVTLRDIRYRRGGREPSTGFDCSGFVHYVFRHSVGQDLPSDSASQFAAGAKVDRADMKTGDLVFFHTRGKRVSHVGIYLGDGRFIHSPSTGKRVSIDRLDESYWSRRFIGAKRPNGLS